MKIAILGDRKRYEAYLPPFVHDLPVELTFFSPSAPSRQILAQSPDAQVILADAIAPVGAELIHAYGPDSALGRTAAVMLGSTETTFYTIAVYFGAVGVSRTRYAVPAALCADVVGFLASAWAVRLLFGT